MASANVAFYSCILASVLTSSIVVTNADDESTIQTVAYSIINQTVRLNCPQSTSRSPSIEWFDLVHNNDRNPQKIFTSTGRRRNMDTSHPNLHNYEVDSNFTLVIRNVRLDDAGTYWCHSGQSESRVITNSYYLAVSGHPKCSGASVMSEGETADFSCEFLYSGNYQPSLEWRRGADDVWPSDDKFNVRLARKEFTLNATAADDGTTFTCRMTFGDIVEECHVNLTVYYNVRKLVIDPLKETYSVGEKIRCSADGNPTPDIMFRPPLESAETGVGWRSAAIPKSFLGQSSKVECVASNTVNGQKLSVGQTINVNVTESESTKENEKEDKGQANLVRSESPSNSGAIIGGIIVGIMILVVIVAAVFCVRLRKEQALKKDENGGTQVQTPPLRDAPQRTMKENRV